jgi:hypothetical protein
MYFRVGNLKGKEERVLHYKFRQTPIFFADTNLPPAVARAKRKNKQIGSTSNPVTIPLPGLPGQAKVEVKV